MRKIVIGFIIFSISMPAITEDWSHDHPLPEQGSLAFGDSFIPQGVDPVWLRALLTDSGGASPFVFLAVESESIWKIDISEFPEGEFRLICEELRSTDNGNQFSFSRSSRKIERDIVDKLNQSSIGVLRLTKWNNEDPHLKIQGETYHLSAIDEFYTYSGWFPSPSSEQRLLEVTLKVARILKRFATDETVQLKPVMDALKEFEGVRVRKQK